MFLYYNMEYVILVHTHSDYYYLWPIINDYMKMYDFKKILLYNKIPENTNLPECFDTYIQYDDSLLFTSRLLSIIDKINTDYIFLIYDVDIVINIDITALTTYIEIMKDNNIDRLCCALFNGSEYKHKNKFAICNLNKPLLSITNHYVPADNTPVIWNKNSLVIFLTNFPNVSYRNLELDVQIIRYCKTQINCYGIQYTPNLSILYNRGLTYCDKISLLHITSQGCLLPSECYASYKHIVSHIIIKYNLNDKIPSCDAPSSCYNFPNLSV